MMTGKRNLTYALLGIMLIVFAAAVVIPTEQAPTALEEIEQVENEMLTQDKGLRPGTAAEIGRARISEVAEPMPKPKPPPKPIAEATETEKLSRVIHDERKEKSNILDVFDLASVGLAYGSFPGDHNYNERADINQDGFINLDDFKLIEEYYG